MKSDGKHQNERAYYWPFHYFDFVKSVTAFLFWILCSFGTLAASIDSLFVLLEDTETHTYERLKAGNQLLNLAEELSYRDLYFTHTKMGELLMGIDSINAAIAFYRKSAVNAKNEANREDVSAAFNNMGVGFLYYGYLDSAKVYLKKSITFGDSINSPLELVPTYMNLGIIDRELGNFEDALKNCLRVLRMPLLDEMTNEKFGCFTNIGLIHFGLKDFGKAIPHHRNALQVALKAENDQDIGAAYNNLGLTFLRIHRLDSAEYFLSLGKGINSGLESRVNLMHTFVHIAELYRLKGVSDSMFFYFRKALTGRTQFGDIHGKTEVYNHLANYFAEKGLRDSTIFYAEKALSSARESNAKQEQLNAVKSLLAAALLENSEPSTALLPELLRLQQELFSEERLRALQNAETKFGTEKKEQQIVLLEREQALSESELKQKTQQVIFLFSGAALVLLLAALFANYQRLKRIGKEKLLQEREKAHLAEKTALKRERELATFKAQIQAQEKERTRISRELHDGIAPALAVARLKVSDTPEQHELLNTLTQITEDLRDLSHQLAPVALDYQTLEESIAHFLAAFDGKDGLTISLAFPNDGMPNFSTEVEITIFRTVQELMTNIVKHAQATSAGFNFTIKADALHLEVHDNGIGIPHKESKTTGIGLNNVKRRMAELGGEVSIPLNQGIGTYVYVVLPLS